LGKRRYNIDSKPVTRELSIQAVMHELAPMERAALPDAEDPTAAFMRSRLFHKLGKAERSTYFPDGELLCHVISKAVAVRQGTLQLT
jgi:hypothetical protein